MKRNQKIGILLGVCVGAGGLGALSVYGRTVAVQGDGRETIEISCPNCGEWIGIDLAYVTDGDNSCFFSWEGQAETIIDGSTAEEGALCRERDSEITSDADGSAQNPKVSTYVEEQGLGAFDRVELARLNEEEEKQKKEYEKVGIIMSEDGSWTYEGQKIRLLLDDNGGLFSNSEGKLYVYVARDDDGNVKTAENVTGRRILEEKAVDDASHE